jgi:hypothetical protein
MRKYNRGDDSDTRHHISIRVKYANDDPYLKTMDSKVFYHLHKKNRAHIHHHHHILSSSLSCFHSRCIYILSSNAACARPRETFDSKVEPDRRENFFRKFDTQETSCIRRKGSCHGWSYTFKERCVAFGLD